MHLIRLRLTPLAGTAVCVFALGLAACGGSSSKGATSTSTTGVGETTAPATGAAPATAAGSSPTCKQLTYDEVQPLFTHKIATVTVTAEGTGQQCVFSGADGAEGKGAIDVLVLGGDLAQQGWSEAIPGETNPVAISGVGDKATRDTGDDQIESIKGNVYCSVSLGSAEDMPGVAKLEAAAGATTHIPESANQAAALALGTLCNRIYGSGNTTPDLSALTG